MPLLEKEVGREYAGKAHIVIYFHAFTSHWEVHGLKNSQELNLTTHKHFSCRIRDRLSDVIRMPKATVGLLRFVCSLACLD